MPRPLGARGPAVRFRYLRQDPHRHGKLRDQGRQLVRDGDQLAPGHRLLRQRQVAVRRADRRARSDYVSPTAKPGLRPVCPSGFAAWRCPGRQALPLAVRRQRSPDSPLPRRFACPGAVTSRLAVFGSIGAGEGVAMTGHVPELVSAASPDRPGGCVVVCTPQHHG